MKRSLTLFPIFLVFYELTMYLANDMYIPALPAIANYFNCSHLWAEWTVSAYVTGEILLFLIVGPLSCIFGRPRILLFGGICFLLTTLGCIFSPSVQWLTFFRMLEGSMLATMYIAGYSVIHDHFEEKEAVKILSRMLAVSVLAPALGPLMGGIILELGGSWQSTFYCIFIMALVAIIGMQLYFPESAKKKEATAVKNLSQNPFKEALHFYKELLRSKLFMSGALVHSLLLVVFLSWVTVSPTVIMEYYGISSTVEYGLLVVPVLGSFSVASYMIGRLMERFGIKTILKAGFTICGVSSALVLLLWLTGSLNVYFLILAMSLYSLGAGLTMSPINRITMTCATAPMDYKTALFFFMGAFLGGFGSIGMSIIANGKPLPLALSIPVLSTSFILIYALRERWLQKADSLRKDKADKEEASQFLQEEPLAVDITSI